MKEKSFGIVPLKKDQGRGWKVLLILHEKGNHWAFPKGHANDKETPLTAAKRELREETGLEVESLLKQQPFKETYRFYRKGDLVFKEVSYFPALVFGDLKLQKEEIKEAKWVSFSEALELLTFEEAKEICKKVMRLVVC